MHAYRRAVAAAIVGIGAVTCVMVGSGQDRLPMGPPKTHGQSISPAFEGWFKNADGSFTLLFGHFNRNSVETFDIPVGPNNRFEPAPADRGQPTYFGGGRGWGVFGVIVPANFGNQRLQWTLNANNQPVTIHGWLNPPYNVNPFQNMANGNTPPTLRYAQTSPSWQGPVNPKMIPTLKATVNQPLPLEIWVEDKGNTEIDPNFGRGRGGRGNQTGAAGGGRGADDAAGRGRGGRGDQAGRGADQADAGGRGRGGRGADGDDLPAVITGLAGGQRGGGRGGAGGGGGGGNAPLSVSFVKFRSPVGAQIKFDPERVPLQTLDLQRVQSTATFTVPGEYMIRATANDTSGDGGGGDQCCWSTAHYRVVVK